MRVLLTFLLLAGLLSAENFKLYLKDGGYHVVSEYAVQQDRVRYYSTERGDWEEIPLDMVDLSKTEKERKARIEEAKQEAAADAEEAKFERAMKREIARIPAETGVYFVQDDNVVALKPAGVKSLNDKKRSILKVVTPIPIVPGKASLEIAGEHSEISVPFERPQLYFRIEDIQRYTIVRMRPKKGVRQVAVLQVEPVSKQGYLDMDTVDVFRQQVQDNLFKVWPTKPLTPGEYALVQYAEGDVEIQVWDFRIPEGVELRK